jgi:hypothetical protein
MKRVRQIYNSLMRAVKEGCVPFGYYGPETYRWATPDEMRRFGRDAPLWTRCAALASKTVLWCT